MSAPDSNELGDTLKQAAEAATPSAIDVDEVLRRSRARRRSRRTAALSGVGAVAAVLAVGGLVLGLQRVGGPTAAEAPAFESAESADVAPDDAAGGTADGTADGTGTRLMAPEQVNRCGAAVATPTDAATSPLAVAVSAPATPVPPGSEARVTVTLTNNGSDTVRGDVADTPALTVAETGIAVWHSSPGAELPPSPITLAPGESTTLEAALLAQRCAASDDLGDGLPAELPPLLPGEYAVGAVVSFTDAADGTITYLVSPLAPFTVG